MRPRNIHTVPHGRKWGNKRAGGTHFLSVHRLQSSAIAVGAKVVRRDIASSTSSTTTTAGSGSGTATAAIRIRQKGSHDEDDRRDSLVRLHVRRLHRARARGHPFTRELVTAIAMQETYYIWGDLYRRLPVDEVLALCAGDTLDAPNRSAFPKRKADLLAMKDGKEMFGVARKALEDVGQYFSRYNEVANMNPNKFCHGFGIFLYDLQFFGTNPRFFLDRQWTSFDSCLALCVAELNAALKRGYGSGKKTLTPEESVYVAIAYNRGTVNFAKGFKQGYRDESGKYYGEHVWTYVQMARKVKP